MGVEGEAVYAVRGGGHGCVRPAYGGGVVAGDDHECGVGVPGCYP